MTHTGGFLRPGLVSQTPKVAPTSCGGVTIPGGSTNIAPRRSQLVMHMKYRPNHFGPSRPLPEIV